jgi:hypothetical protein
MKEEEKKGIATIIIKLTIYIYSLYFRIAVK